MWKTMNESCKRKFEEEDCDDTQNNKKKPRSKSGDLMTFHNALKNKNEVIVDKLLKRGVSVFEKDDNGFSALYYAVQSNSREMIQKVLDKGVSVDDPQGRISESVLSCAVVDGLTTSVDFLLKKNCNVNLTNPHACWLKECSPFIHAVAAGKVSWVKRMLRRGAIVNGNRKEKTPLEVAVDEGHTDVARTLLDHGATFRVKPGARSTLHVAATKSAAMIKLIVERGWADVDIEDANGATPLFEALYFGRLEEAVALLEAGANVNHVDRIKRSALHVAESVDLVKMLIQRGADLDAKDSSGNNPLLKWAIEDRADLVEPLISAGSNVDDENNKGLSFRKFSRNLDPDSYLFKVATRSAVSAESSLSPSPPDDAPTKSSAESWQSSSPPDDASDGSAESSPPDDAVHSSASKSTPLVNPLMWTVSDVCDFIRALPGCTDYAEDFAIQEIDGEALMLLKVDYLMSVMALKLGPALKICARIDSMRGAPRAHLTK